VNGSICQGLPSTVRQEKLFENQVEACLDQAALVAGAQIVDWDMIKRWCIDEGDRGAAAFEELQRLTGTS